MIHVSLEGIVKTNEDQKALIQQIETVCQNEKIPFEINKNEGTIYVCPCGSIDIRFENYYMVAKTNTALVGAGYHVAVCELFQKIIDQGPIYLSIDDECNYLEDHDFERIKETYFIPYMSQLMEQFSKMKEDDEATYAWDDKSYLPLAKENGVITPFGYIYGKECSKLSLAEACDAYFIWNSLEKDALFYRNSALVSLWCDCLFEKSIYDEKHLNLAKSICNALEKAHELDSSLALSVDEYQLLCKVLNRQIQIFDVDQYPNKNIGYRKNHVFYVYGNWFIYFIGNAIQKFDGHTMILEIKEDNMTQCSMKISGYKNNENMDFAYRYLNSVDALDSIDFENEGVHTKGVLHELNDGSGTLYLQAQSIKQNEMLMINIECKDMSYYRQAVQMLENIQMFIPEKNETNIHI